MIDLDFILEKKIKQKNVRCLMKVTLLKITVLHLVTNFILKCLCEPLPLQEGE